MKSLLIKEFQVMKRNGTLLYLSAMIFAVICNSIADQKLRLLTLFLFYIITAALSIGSLNQDKISKMDLRFEAMPFSKGQIIGSKYLLHLCSSVLALAVTAISTVIRSFAIEPALTQGEICFTVIGFSLMVISFSLGFSMALRFNPLAGYVTSLGLVGFSCGFLAARADRASSFDMFTPALASAVAAVAIIAFVASWAVSVSIYKKQGVKEG